MEMTILVLEQQFALPRICARASFPRDVLDEAIDAIYMKRYCIEARSHGGHLGEGPQMFCDPRKICFKHIIKTKSWSPKSACSSVSLNLVTGSVFFKVF